jgi:hypothetical protein
VQARVDHFHPGISQRSGDDFGAAVVAVEAGLGDEDSDWSHMDVKVSGDGALAAMRADTLVVHDQGRST